MAEYKLRLEALEDLVLSLFKESTALTAEFKKKVVNNFFTEEAIDEFIEGSSSVSSLVDDIDGEKIPVLWEKLNKAVLTNSEIEAVEKDVASAQNILSQLRKNWDFLICIEKQNPCLVKTLFSKPTLAQAKSADEKSATVTNSLK